MLNPEVYESACVNIGQVSMNGGTTLFQPFQNYVIYQKKATTALNTLYNNANYINTPIPEDLVTICGIVNYDRGMGTVTITPRSLNDFMYEHGNDKKGSWNADDFFSADGYLQIRALSRQPIYVYTETGNLIIYEWVDPGFHELLIPTTGVYIVKLGALSKKIAIP